MPAILASVWLAAALLIACGNSSSTLSLNLEDVVLDEQSVPQIFALMGHKRMDNGSMAQQWSDPDAMATNYEAWGRKEGIEAEFNTGTIMGNFISRIGVYDAEEGAKKAFNYMRREGKISVIEGFQEHGFTQDGGFEDLKDPEIGDESFALYGQFSMPAATSKNMWTIFRKENVISLLRWRSDTNEIEHQVMAEIAQKQLDLILR